MYRRLRRPGDPLREGTEGSELPRALRRRTRIRHGLLLNPRHDAPRRLDRPRSDGPSEREPMNDQRFGCGEMARGAAGDWSGDPDDERPAKDPFEGARTDPGEASVVEGDLHLEEIADPLGVECPLCGALKGRPCLVQSPFRPYRTAKTTHSARIKKAKRNAEIPPRP